MLRQRLVREPVQLTCSGIGLELLVPTGSVELGKPVPELRELGTGEGGDFALDLLDLGHMLNVARSPVVG